MHVILDGQLRGTIRGFHNRETIFEFTNGAKWRQAEYKYLYQYLYRPYAKVLDGPDGAVIQIEGIDETVRVRRTY